MATRQELFSPVNAFIQGRAARQQHDYGQSRNALAQMELDNAPREMERRNKLLDIQTEGAQMGIDAERAKIGYAKLKQALDSGNPKSYVLQREPELVAKLNQSGVDFASLDDRQAAAVIDGFAREYAGKAGIIPVAPPVQLETIEGPGGSILQLDPKTKKLTSVLGREPKGTTVNVNTKQETEEAKAIGRELGQQYVDIQKAGTSATGKVNKLDRLSSLLEGVRTGKLTPKMTELATFAESFGVKIDETLDQKQAAQALIGELVLQARNPSGGAGMPGAMSDADREFLKSINPSLAQTTGGNKLIIETLRKLAKRDQEVAKMAREYRAKNRTLEGFSDELARWSAENELFDTESALSGGGSADFIYVPGRGLQPSR